MAKVAKKKVNSRKKTAKRRVSKKTAVRRVAKKKVARKPAKKTTARRVAKKVTATRKRNPAPLFWLQVGRRYFNGVGLTRDARKASYYKSRDTAVVVANRLASTLDKDVAVHTNQPVKKK